MITGELKSKVDAIWDTMWSGGVSNPLSVIEQLTYLLFIKRLDELFAGHESVIEGIFDTQWRVKGNVLAMAG
jgi:hypothetical protein